MTFQCVSLKNSQILGTLFSVLREKKNICVRETTGHCCQSAHVTGNIKSRLLWLLESCPPSLLSCLPCPRGHGRRSAAAWVCRAASPPNLSFSYGQITSSPWQLVWIKSLATAVEPGDTVWKSAVASVSNYAVEQLPARGRGGRACIAGWNSLCNTKLSQCRAP